MVEAMMRVIERHPDDEAVAAAMSQLTTPLLDSLKVISETSMKVNIIHPHATVARLTA